MFSHMPLAPLSGSRAHSLMSAAGGGCQRPLRLTGEPPETKALQGQSSSPDAAPPPSHSGFLSIANVWGQIILCWGGVGGPVHRGCTMLLGSFPGLHPGGASSTLPGISAGTVKCTWGAEMSPLWNSLDTGQQLHESRSLRDGGLPSCTDPLHSLNPHSTPEVAPITISPLRPGD